MPLIGKGHFDHTLHPQHCILLQRNSEAIILPVASHNPRRWVIYVFIISSSQIKEMRHQERK